MAASDPNVKHDGVNLAATWTNAFASKAAEKYKA